MSDPTTQESIERKVALELLTHWPNLRPLHVARHYLSQADNALAIMELIRAAKVLEEGKAEGQQAYNSLRAEIGEYYRLIEAAHLKDLGLFLSWNNQKKLNAT